MSDESSRNDPLADVINVLAAPIAGGLRSVEQFQRGVSELFRAVENLNQTLENLNETAMRVNRLVAEIEEPVRVMTPQVTRTIKAADEMTSLLEGPVRVAAPQIERIVETLSSPGFAELPNQLGDFMQSIGDVSTRLGPLTQFAENAGGLLGSFKLPGMPGAPKPTGGSSDQDSESARSSANMHVAVKRSSSTTSGATTPASTPSRTKKSPAKKSATKKSPAKQSSAKRSSAKKPPAKKSPAKKSAANESAAGRTADNT